MIEMPPAPRAASGTDLLPAPPAGADAPAAPSRAAPHDSSTATRITAGGPTATLQHQPALDGLRGIAVAAVLLYHGAIADRIDALAPWTQGGFLGVSAFFTLSGFLICSLLVVEHRSSGAISLRGFWSRRFRRLLPASLVLIGAVVVLTPVLGTPSQLEGLRGDVWASLADVANWRFIFTGSDYAAQFSGPPSPLQHLWSLSVEEQWYLLVPIVAAVALTLRRVATPWQVRYVGGRRALATLLGLGIAASLGLMLWLGGGAYSNRVYLGTDTRFAEMGVGALMAVLLAARFQLPERARRAVVVAGVPALAVLLVLWSRTALEASWLYRGGLLVHAVLVAVVILAAVQASGPVRRALAVAPLVALGRISYAVYLFHWPIMWWVTPERLHVGPTAALVVQCALTVGLAALSFRLWEQPVRRGRLVTGWRRPVVPLAAIATIAVGALFLPEADPAGIIAVGNNPKLVVPTTRVPATTASTTPAPAPEAGAPAPTTVPPTTVPPPPLKVLVVGDSFANSMTMGLQRWAMSSGKMSVLDDSIVACGFGRGGRNKGVGFNRAWSAECQARDATVARDIASFRPDVVFLAGGLWDVTDRLVPSIGRWSHPGDPAYDAYLVGELRHLADLVQSQGSSLVWANSPHWNPIPGSVIFMGKPPYKEADPARADRFNQLLAEALAGRPNARILDLASWMQSQPGGELAPSLRVDGVHFSLASTDMVGTWLGGQLLAGVGRS